MTDDGKYVALDFGIMGTLTEVDKNYLAQNFLAFFNRDYRRVAQAHLDAGWVPAGTRVDEFETAIRAVCEPIFARPLKEIYFGRLLLRLFQTARRFNMEVQPQLVLLQKTLLNIEGLGRELDPDLDLWRTAKPYLERWMSEQVGWRGLLRSLRAGGAVLGGDAAAAAAPACTARSTEDRARPRCATALRAPRRRERAAQRHAVGAAGGGDDRAAPRRRRHPVVAQDSSRPDFWDTRFRGGVTPWDAAGVPPHLSKWIENRTPCRVLIPGCGSGYEVRLFAAHGHDVLAIDFSDAAVEAARKELGEPLARLVAQQDFFSFDDAAVRSGLRARLPVRAAAAPVAAMGAARRRTGAPRRRAGGVLLP